MRKADSQYWIVTVQEELEPEEGKKPKKVKSKYLIDAVSPTDVEVKVAEEIGQLIDYKIISIVESNINYIID